MKRPSCFASSRPITVRPRSSRSPARRCRPSSTSCKEPNPMISGTRYRLTAEINRQSDLAREIARAQMEISTQKRIINPSDEPIGAARVAEIDCTQENEEVWRSDVETAARSDEHTFDIQTTMRISYDVLC